MREPVIRTLRNVRSRRDLRAEIADLAATVLGRNAPGELHVIAPMIHPDTVRAEWDRLMPIMSSAIRDRLDLVTFTDEHRPVESDRYPLPRPNYRYETLRLLIGAKLEDDGPQQERWLENRIGIAKQSASPKLGRRTPQQLTDAIGASQTPVRSALADLEQAGLVRNWGHGSGFEVDPEELSLETLARLGALPQIIRFRFERGSKIKPPVTMLERAKSLLRPGTHSGWEMLALSGVPVAVQDVPTLDLVGIPRLDLAAKVERDATDFDLGLLRALDDGLELETNVLASAPVVVTLVRSGADFFRNIEPLGVRCATRADVLMSLLDMGLREHALAYAKGLPP